MVLVGNWNFEYLNFFITVFFWPILFQDLTEFGYGDVRAIFLGLKSCL